MTEDKEYKLVLIEWLDSIGGGSNWRHLNEMPTDVKPIRIKSVGYVVKRSKEAIVIAPHLAPSWEEDGGQMCGDMTIPVCCIVKEIELFYTVSVDASDIKNPQYEKDYPQYVFSTSVDETEKHWHDDPDDCKHCEGHWCSKCEIKETDVTVIGKHPYPEIGRNPNPTPRLAEAVKQLGTVKQVRDVMAASIASQIENSNADER